MVVVAAAAGASESSQVPALAASLSSMAVVSSADTMASLYPALVVEWL